MIYSFLKVWINSEAYSLLNNVGFYLSVLAMNLNFGANFW